MVGERPLGPLPRGKRIGDLHVLIEVHRERQCIHHGIPAALPNIGRHHRSPQLCRLTIS